MRLSVQLGAAERSAQEARAVVRERFAEQMPAITLHDLLTVVTELVTNAVRYGDGDVVGLAVVIDRDGRVRGEVSNRGGGRVEIRAIHVGRNEGLGLHIVDAIAERWDVETNGETRVTFVLPLT